MHYSSSYNYSEPSVLFSPFFFLNPPTCSKQKALHLRVELGFAWRPWDSVTTYNWAYNPTYNP